MISSLQITEEYLFKISHTVRSLNLSNIVSLTGLIEETVQKTGDIYIIGNGGSAANSIHVANDLNTVFEKYELNSKAVSLTENISSLTRIANDISFENIFENQLRNKLGEKDLLIAFSTSGKSINIIKALEFARHKTKIVLITHNNNLNIDFQIDLVICIPSENTQITEDFQLIIFHLVSVILAEHLHG